MYFNDEIKCTALGHFANNGGNRMCVCVCLCVCVVWGEGGYKIRFRMNN